MKSTQRNAPSRPRWATIAVAVLAMAMLGVAACGDDDDDSGSGGGSGGDITIGYSSPILSQPSQQAIADGIEQAAKSLGWDAIALDANLSPDKQASDLQTLLTKDVSGIVFAALDPQALQGAFEQAQAENVPLVGLPTGGPQVNTNVLWDTFLCRPGGEADQEAKYISERKPGGKVIVVQQPAFQPHVEKAKCFVDAAKAAGLDVVVVADNPKDSAQGAQAVVADLLQKFPEVDAVWGHNDAAALGSSAALNGAGKSIWSGDEEGVIVIGHTADPDGLEAIRQGRLTATFDSRFPELGYAAVGALRPVLADGKPISSMPKEIAVESMFYDAENIADYVPNEDRKVSFDSVPLLDWPPAK